MVITINFIAIFTGFAIFVGCVTPLLFAYDCWREIRVNKHRGKLYIPLFALVAVLSSVVLFSINYKFAPAVNGFSFPDPRWYLYPVFVFIEFASAVMPNSASKILEIVVGAFIVLSLLWILVQTIYKSIKCREGFNDNRIIIFLITFSLVFSINAAIGRLCLGLNAATAPRYVSLLIPGYIGGYFFLLKEGHLTRNYRNALILLCATLFVSTPLLVKDAIVQYQSGKVLWANAYIATGSIERAKKYRILQYIRRKNCCLRD